VFFGSYFFVIYKPPPLVQKWQYRARGIPDTSLREVKLAKICEFYYFCKSAMHFQPFHPSSLTLVRGGINAKFVLSLSLSLSLSLYLSIYLSFHFSFYNLSLLHVLFHSFLSFFLFFPFNFLFYACKNLKKKIRPTFSRPFVINWHWDDCVINFDQNFETKSESYIYIVMLKRKRQICIS